MAARGNQRYVLTCNDSIKAMAREDITAFAHSLDEAWDKAKTKFAKKHKTKKEYVNITAVQHICNTD